MTPEERALWFVLGVLAFFAGSWTTATDTDGSYRRPRLATLVNAIATSACVYGAREQGAGSWLGLLCAVGAIGGAWWTLRAGVEALADRKAQRSERKGGAK